MQDARVEAVEFGGIEAGRAKRDRGEVERRCDRREVRVGLDRQRGAGEHRHDGDGHRFVVGLAQIHERQRAEALRQPLAIGAGQQVVVGEGRHGAAQRLEDLDLCAGVADVILAADDVGDAEIDVIDHRGQRVEVAAIGADQHRVGHRGGVDGLRPLDQVVEVHRLAIEPEAPVRRAALGLVLRLLLGREVQRGAVVDWRAAEQPGAGALAVQFLLGLPGRVEAARGDEAVAGVVVKRGAVGLADLQVRGDAEPGKVGLDARRELFGRARAVGVVEAEDVLAGPGLGEQPVQQRRAGIAEMQAAGRGRGVADDGGHGHGKGTPTLVPLRRFAPSSTTLPTRGREGSPSRLRFLRLPPPCGEGSAACERSELAQLGWG